MAASRAASLCWYLIAMMASSMHHRHVVAAPMEALRRHGNVEVRTATLDQPDHGLTEEVLRETDVLTWWGHAAHDQVRDDIIEYSLDAHHSE